MAGTLNRGEVFPTLDDAVDLLRQAPLSTLVCHWIGSVPFALAMLRFWNDMTNPRIGQATGAVEALVLAMLLVWMNCWRSIFAGRLRRQLTGAPEAPWTWKRVTNLAAGQALWGSTKLLAMPLATLILFPLAATVACYRNIAVLGDRSDLDPLQLMARARRLAMAETRQSWALLPILTFLYLVLTLNLAIVLGVLPQVFRMLTGYETAFSRSGYFFVINPLFLLLVIAVSWIAFDPYLQAVYCVRCFRVESMETGEDLRAGLRRIRRGVAAAAIFVMLATAGHLSAAVPARDLEKSVHDTLQSHEYDWRLPAAPAAPQKTSWLVRFTDRMIAGFRWLSDQAGEWIKALFRWLTGQRLSIPQGGQAPAKGLHWSLYVITAAVILMAVAIVWRKRWLRRPKTDTALVPATVAVRLDAEDLSPDRLPEEEWMALAENCLRDRNFRLALRATYLANLAWLGRMELLSIHSGKTNREYALELRRKARSVPEVRSLFAANIDAFERAWYGLHDVAAVDVADFRSRVERMKAVLPSASGVAA